MKTSLLPIILFSLAMITGCKKDLNNVTIPPLEIQEEELLTTLLVHLYEIDLNGDTNVFAFRDTDGPGGNPSNPIDTIFLHAPLTYGCFLKVLNESHAPPMDVTIEIEQEANDHLFCYDTNGMDLEITPIDTVDNFTVGLESQWSTQSATIGSLTITLKHQPGIKDGTCEPGTTDIEVTFPVVIF